jgi:glycosyltransferase involved in cell wall biosynthesis
MEALACGRPVLVSDIPSNKEWVKPGEVGDVFTDGCVTSLEDRLLALASSPDLGAYGWRARQLALVRADWNSNFQKLERAYQMARS